MQLKNNKEPYTTGSQTFIFAAQKMKIKLLLSKIIKFLWVSYKFIKQMSNKRVYLIFYFNFDQNYKF